MARPAKSKSQPTVARPDTAKGQPLSRERIAADLAAFRKSGGRIEVLQTPWTAPRGASSNDAD